jgi:hypothetical protein
LDIKYSVLEAAVRLAPHSREWIIWFSEAVVPEAVAQDSALEAVAVAADLLCPTKHQERP